MNVQFSLQQSNAVPAMQFIGNGGGMVSRSDAAHSSQGASQAVVVDASMLEISTIRQGFFDRLSSAENPSETFTLLHSEIMENYDGEERDKRTATLHSVGRGMGIEMRTVNARGHTTVWNADGWTVNWDKSDGWMRVPGQDSPINLITLDSLGRNRGTTSAALFNAVFQSDGIEAGMATFEAIYQELHRLFDGDELQSRLESLREGFETAGYWFQHNLAHQLAQSSEHFDPNEPTAYKHGVNERIRIAANELTAHLGDMFRVALDFFLATGSFAGFFDAAEANPSDGLSFRDAAILSTFGGNFTSSDIMNIQGLSSSGSASLLNFLSVT